MKFEKKLHFAHCSRKSSIWYEFLSLRTINSTF